ncbi:MAG: polysaccharide biosynthesis/export family protein [Vicinamibacterales bacterium]
MKRLRCLSWVVCIVFASFDARAQTQQRDPGMVSNYTPASTWKKRDFQVGFWRLAKVSKDYTLGPGDEIQVGIYGVPTLSDLMQSTKISNAGEITVPLLGIVKAAGFTAEQLETAIGDAFKAKDLIEHPEVLITVLEYQAKPIYVIGEVDNPGQYIMSQPWTISEAILIAGGLDISAANVGYLHRRVSRDSTLAAPSGPPQVPDVAMPGYQVTKLDLRPMKLGGVLQPDFPLQVGDLLVVPPRRIEVAFVIGDVARKGPSSCPKRLRFPSVECFQRPAARDARPR